MAKELNPMEQLVEDLSDIYVATVFSLEKSLAPSGPWWAEDLSPDQQLWRWMSGGRDEIVEWLTEAAGLLGWEVNEPVEGAPLLLSDETLKNWITIFTDNSMEALLHPSFVSKIPIALLELVQAAGPDDAAKHVRKMERMLEGRLQAFLSLGNQRERRPRPAEPEPEPEGDTPEIPPLY